MFHMRTIALLATASVFIAGYSFQVIAKPFIQKIVNAFLCFPWLASIIIQVWNMK